MRDVCVGWGLAGGSFSPYLHYNKWMKFMSFGAYKRAKKLLNNFSQGLSITATASPPPSPHPQP